MRKLLIIFLALVSPQVLALEAVVTVLETPMFKYRSYEAPVVQYLRKGDVIKIHPSLANTKEFDHHAPSPEKLAQIKKQLEKSNSRASDPLFQNKNEEAFFPEDEFIPMLDRQGNIVYVLSAHLFIYFEDKRELEQKILHKDPTDYRLEEPLPKNYPLSNPSGYRGQFLLGFTQPYYESYNYRDNFKSKGYTTPIALNLTVLRQAPGKYQERLFIGGTMDFRTFQNSYRFVNRRFSEEEWNRFGIGPTISYDAFKGQQNRLNLSMTIVINLVDQLHVSQKQDGIVDSRVYTGHSLTPRLALQYHRKQIHDDLDFVLGTTMEFGSATTYHATNPGDEASWWQKLRDDKFTTRTTFALGGYLGIQSAY